MSRKSLCEFDRRAIRPQFSPEGRILTTPVACHMPRRGSKHCSCAALPRLSDWTARLLPSGHDPVTFGLPGSRCQGTILSDEVAPGGAGGWPVRDLSIYDKAIAVHIAHCEGSWNRSASSCLLSRSCRWSSTPWGLLRVSKPRPTLDPHWRCAWLGSRYQVLAQGFAGGLSTITSAKLYLRLLEVTAHGLLAKPERFGNLARLPAV